MELAFANPNLVILCDNDSAKEANFKNLTKIF